VYVDTSLIILPEGSVGERLMENMTRAAIVSYVGAILIKVRYTKKLSGLYIRFSCKPNT